MRSPLLSLALGLVAIFVAASYWGYFLHHAGSYRTLPWGHLAALPLVAGLAIAVVRRGRGHQGGVRRLFAWTGAAVATAATFVLWSFLFIGSRLPDAAAPSLTIAPEIALPDDAGEVVRLSRLREGGPVVVAFFRGAFDGWARPALTDLDRIRGRVEAGGGHIVALSGDPVAELRGLKTKLGLGYPLLSDRDLAVARAYGVVQEDAGTPRPFVLVVRRDGTVAWSHFARSLRDLPDPERIVREVAAASE